MLKPIEHKFKALFFRLLKSTLQKRSGDNKPLEATKIKTVIFFRPERIGDMVVTLPIVDGLKTFFPQIKVSVLASPKNLDLIKDDPRFDEIFLYTKDPRRDITELFRIRHRKFDCVIDTICDDSVTALFLSHFCAAGKPIIGVGKEKYKEYYNFSYANRTGHIIDNSLKLLEAFGISSEELSGFAAPYLSTTVQNNAEVFVNSFSKNGSRPVRVGYNLSSGAPTRVWPRDKCVKLISNILASFPESQVVLIAVPGDRAQALSISNQFAKDVQVVPDNLGISEVSAIIKYLDVLVTPDTSLVHIARANRVPVVGLYSKNSKNFGLWHPYAMIENAVTSQSDDNIFDITVDQVMDKLLPTIISGMGIKR